MKKLGAVARLIRLDRPIGTYLLLWPTLSALWIAGDGHPSLKNLVIFGLGVFLMRSAGCAINDFADRNIDGEVERTKLRPLASGELSAKEALITFGILLGLAALLVIQTNLQTILLACAAAAVAALYPFMKRYTHLPQLVLGVAFSFGIPMAFTAEEKALSLGLALFWLANVLWVLVYDTFYAMVDREDDLKIGVKSTAVLFGDNDKKITAVLQVLSIVLLQTAANYLQLGALVYIGIALAFACFMYQQWLIKDRQKDNCFAAFLNNNFALFILFAAVVLDSSVY